MSDAPPADANATCVGPESAQAGKAASCEGCPSQKACASGDSRAAAAATDATAARVKARLAGVKRKLLVLSGKGGVGKSTVSCQLAFALAGRGFAVRRGVSFFALYFSPSNRHSRVVPRVPPREIRSIALHIAIDAGARP